MKLVVFDTLLNVELLSFLQLPVTTHVSLMIAKPETSNIVSSHTLLLNIANYCLFSLLRQRNQKTKTSYYFKHIMVQNLDSLFQNNNKCLLFITPLFNANLNQGAFDDITIVNLTLNFIRQKETLKIFIKKEKVSI